MLGSWGPMILGHNHPEVLAKSMKEIEKGTSFGLPTQKIGTGGTDKTCCEPMKIKAPRLAKLRGRRRQWQR